MVPGVLGSQVQEQEAWPDGREAGQRREDRQGCEALKEGEAAPQAIGISLHELIEAYGEVSGRDMSSMPWFFALACYKLGILLEGSHARASAGMMPKATGDSLHAYASWLFAKGTQFIATA